MIRANDFSDTDLIKNREAVISALQFTDNGLKVERLHSGSLPNVCEIPPDEELLSEEDVTIKYLIERKIGQGAFGEVHIGRDNLTDKRVFFYFDLIFVTFC